MRQNSNVFLRPFQLADAPVVAAHLQDKDISRFTENIPWPYTCENAIDWIHSALNLPSNKGVIWAACDSSTEQLIGAIELSISSDNLDAEIMYWIGKSSQNQGNGKAAVAVALLHAESVLKIKYLSARVHQDNEPSIRLLSGLGFKMVGQFDGSMLTMKKSMIPG